jgi:HAD superfamily hydrolase (TIGR01549 family)
MAGGRVSLRAVLFDVDFTIAKPGPLLGPEGYRDAGRRYGLVLDPQRYAEARGAALLDLHHHPELDHDEEVWIRFTEDIVRGMGGEGETCRQVAVAITDGWLESENFELYEDVFPTFEALREASLKLGLVSNTSRDLDAFVRHHGLDVDAWVSSGVHGKVKPSPSIFKAVLELLGVAPSEAVMIGDSPEDDVAGAQAVGIRGLLLDREGKLGREDALPTLLALPAALGLKGHAA